MKTYKYFDQVIGEILYKKKSEFSNICIKYEEPACYFYQRYRPFDDSTQSIDYNLITDLVEYVCETTLIQVKIIDDKMIPTHYYTTGLLPIGYLEPPYGKKYILAQPESECKRILRGIFWLLFTKRYKLTDEDRRYIRRKYWTQRVYEFENKKKIIPDYIYRFYNTILFFDKKSGCK